MMGVFVPVTAQSTGQMEGELRRFLNRAYAADAVAAGYAAAYFVWMLLRTPGTNSTELISDLFFLPLGLVVAWACWRVGRLPHHDRRSRLAWYFLALSAVCLWITGNLWSVYLRMLGPQNWPLWLDTIDPLSSLVAIAAYALFPWRTLPAGSRLRARLDVALVVVAGLVLSFHFGLRTMPGRTAPVWSFTVGLMVVEWVLFVSAAVGVVRKRDATTRLVLGLLLIGHASSLLANYWLNGMAAYHAGDAVDVLWFLTWVTKWGAARTAWHRYRLGLARSDSHTDDVVAGYRASAFAYIMVAAALSLLVVLLIGGDRRFLELMGTSTLVMVALLTLRQVAGLSENRRLVAVQLAQESRFRSLIHSTSDLVLIADAEGVISFVSPSGVRMFGNHPALREGALVTGFLPADAVAVLADATDERQAGTPRIKTSVQTASGQWRSVEVTATDQREDPAVAGIVYTCRDITEREELEQKLMHTQKRDAVGRLAGGLAHDLNNVLTAIRGYAELLADELPPGTKAGEDLLQIQQASDKAAGITKKLLGLSRNQSVQRSTLQLNDVVRGLQPILRQLLPDRVEVRLHLDPNLGVVRADQGQMEQLLINLATNARDAMPTGGQLHVRTANCNPADIPGALLSSRAGDYVSLSVTDEGVGMSADLRSRVFEPFFTTKPQDRGMGLGLSMVHDIVTESGGVITVDSEPGHGSTFTVLLPGLAAETMTPPAEAAAVRAMPRGRSVLIVDDEPAIRTVARRALERVGYHVVDAPSGAEALAIAGNASVPIDVLLTDMVMPGMHGRELIERFRTIRPDVPVVCMSGYTDDSSPAVDLGESVVALVAKPFTVDALIRALEKIEP